MSEPSTPPLNPSESVESERHTLKRIKRILRGRKPYYSGTLSVKEHQLVLFYGKDESIAGRIDFGNVSPEQLERLAHTCDPIISGASKELILDERTRKPKKLDTHQFCPIFDADNLTRLLQQEFIADDKQGVSIHLVRDTLNVYEPGSYLEPHVDTPSEESGFGSLVIVFPTAHEGGSLVLRDAGETWTVNPAHDISMNPDPCVAFVAFHGDVEREVLPVTSGYCITMTYRLYYDMASPTLTYIPTSPDSNSEQLKAAFMSMLDNPNLLPKGGYLGFGLSRSYNLKGLSPYSGLDSLARELEGSDALLLKICKDLSIDVSLRILYRDENYGGYCHDVLSREVHDFDSLWEEGPLDHVADCGGLRVAKDMDSLRDSNGHLADTTIVWVVKQIYRGYFSLKFVESYQCTPHMREIVGYLCIIVAVGPYGDRKNTGKIESLKEKPEESEELEKSEEEESEESEEETSS
ncbi:hypothetical protein QCA50_019749 [Cerrena zonata]|uniref:Fe2OG dioxygenase domain-containing protein n=1 Tax=Cerrena zonata TaxID=2478898 RepID=A0AAW0FA24_9APHY